MPCLLYTSDIKATMERPDFDREAVLNSQRAILEVKKSRLERLISSIDGILKGENEMDFEVFSRDEIKELYDTMVSNMEDVYKRQRQYSRCVRCRAAHRNRWRRR